MFRKLKFSNDFPISKLCTYVPMLLKFSHSECNELLNCINNMNGLAVQMLQLRT